MQFRKGGDSEDWFFLAMAHWQQGDQDEGRTWFDLALLWMQKHRPDHKDLRRYRTEAEQLLGLKEAATNDGPRTNNENGR